MEPKISETRAEFRSVGIPSVREFHYFLITVQRYRYISQILIREPDVVKAEKMAIEEFERIFPLPSED